MKRCPECRRNYYDETLSFCLEDGAPLVSGVPEEPATAILTETAAEYPTVRAIQKTLDVTDSRAPTSAADENVGTAFFQKKYWLMTGIIAILAAVGLFGAYRYFSPNGRPSESIRADASKESSKLYWQMTEAEQLSFIKERSRQVQTLIGDEPVELESDAFKAIKAEVDWYVQRRDSLSQKPFQEGLRIIYGRATQYAPLVVGAYETHRVAPALGLYQAMVESEYRDCDPSQLGHGLFGFSKQTATKYGVGPHDLCNVEKQLDAAARYMSDLASDFGGQKPNPTLALLAYADGETNVRDMLRQMRSKGITEQSFWIILSHNAAGLDDFGRRYVPRFFAAAIIGETPEAFELTTPPLTSVHSSGK